MIFDEFIDKKFKVTDLNRLINGQITQVPVKGSFVPFTSTSIIIISNYNSESMFRTEPVLREAFIRRVDEEAVFHCLSENENSCIYSLYDLSKHPKQLKLSRVFNYPKTNVQNSIKELTTIIANEREREKRK